MPLVPSNRKSLLLINSKTKCMSNRILLDYRRIEIRRKLCHPSLFTDSKNAGEFDSRKDSGPIKF